MNKIIITADIHLAHFNQYCLFGDDNFRDKQFLRFADRLVEVGKENNTKTLIIAGDIIEKPLLTSQENHLLIDFVNRLGYFEHIYYINGNHDLSRRQDDVTYTDSVINVLDRFGKMQYMHNKSIDICGKKFYFRDYIHGDIPPCPPGTDVFIGHITIGGGPLAGQTFVDPDSFKICIAGDIHKPIDAGKIHSVGCPLQKNLCDPPNGTIGILDVDSLEYTRVPVATKDNKFLRIYRQGEEVDHDEYTKIVERNEKLNTITIENSVGDKLQTSINNINDLVENTVSEFADIHNRFKLQVPAVDPVDLNFNLKTLHVENFKSIIKFDYDFTKNKGLKRIYGHNGSGKSAIVTALKVALIGDRRIKSFQKADVKEDKLFLEVELSYQGIDYKIERTIGKTQFYINGVKTNGSSKKDTEASILKALPFLEYLDLFFLSHSSKFFDKFKDSKLIDNLFGLNSLVKYFELSENELLAKKRELKQIDAEIAKLEGSVSIIESEIKDTSDALAKYDVSIEEFNSAKEVIDKIKSLRETISIENGNLSHHEKLLTNNVNPYKKCDDIDKVKTDLKALKNAIETKENLEHLDLNIKNMKSRIESSKIKCHNCGAIQNASEILNLEKKLGDLERERSEIVDSFPDKTKDEIKAKFYTLKKIYEDDYNYVNFQNKLESSSELIKELKGKIELRVAELKKICNGFTSSNLALEHYGDVITSYYNKKSIEETLNRQKSKRTDILNKLINQNSIKREVSNNILRLSSYKKIFDKESEISIYNKIIQVISNALSDDEIKFYPEDGDLVFTIKVGDLWIEFDDASEGQRALMDLLLLQKMTQLIPNIGLLVFDEVGASLDQSKWSRFSQIMSEFVANDIFVISHSELFSGCERGIETKLINNRTSFSFD